MSIENYGRYHRSSKSDTDIHLFAHKILTEGIQDSYVRHLVLLLRKIDNQSVIFKQILFIFKLSHIPDFESDDLKRLANEINKARQFLKQSITFYRMYDKRDDFHEGKINQIFFLYILSIILFKNQISIN